MVFLNKTGKETRIMRTRFLTALTVMIAVMALLIMSASPAAANPLYASIVIDADTGMVLHQRHADARRHPASLSKVMTLILTFDALENGTLRLRDRVPVSRHAASMVPSKLDLPVGSSIRVEDAIYALVTRSANDVAAALAEKIGGTEEGFARMMTRKAREIGMSNTTYRNASGLHHPQQVSTARDQARLAQYLLSDYAQYYHYFSTRQFTYNGVTHRNHNRLLNTYRGMDGLKTGYINASGFNLTATAVRNNRRIIGVVFGGRTTASRNSHMARLLDNGFERVNEIMMASNAPVPSRKPDQASIMAAARAQNEAGREQARWAALNPMLQSKAFSALIGQGDFDQAETSRLETGLMAIAAHKGDDDHMFRHAAAQTGTRTMEQGSARTDTSTGRWAVQVGAFASRIKTDHIIKQAQRSLPQDIAHAVPVIVPLRTENGWLFRGRLSGLSKEEAERACRYLSDCLPVSPQAH